MVSSSLSKPAVELRHLKAFLAVADAMSFSKAAEHLGISQPPLSRQIKRLEAKLEVQLFDRRHAQIQLTAAGRVFADSARRIIDQMERSIQDAQQVSQGLSGELTLGVDGTALGCDEAIAFIAAYQTRFPQLRIQIEELDALTQLKALQAGEISLGVVAPWAIAAQTQNPDIAAQAVVYDTLSAVLPAFHPLAALNRQNGASAIGLSFLDIAHEPAVMDTNWRDYLHHLCQQQYHHTFYPQIAQVARDYRLMLSFVASGRGISILPATTEQKVPCPDVVYRPLQPATEVEVLSVIWRQDETRPVMTALLRAIAQTGIRQTTNLG